MQIGPLAPGHFDAAVALWHDVGLTVSPGAQGSGRWAGAA
jgi:hypothetical protein